MFLYSDDGDTGDDDDNDDDDDDEDDDDDDDVQYDKQKAGSATESRVGINQESPTAASNPSLFSSNLLQCNRIQ